MKFQKLKNILIGGSIRTAKAKKNILASFVIKGLSILVGFLMVPMVINYLNTTNYGIWITISSFLSWFTFFQIGLGAGLKNKLAVSFAKENTQLAKIYVSTTYAMLSIIITIVATLFFIGNMFIDWTAVLNAPKGMSEELNVLALIVFGFFFLRFVLKLIGSILLADQRPALSNLFGPLGNLFALIIIYFLSQNSNGSLIYLGLTISTIPVVVLLIGSVILFSGQYKEIRPSLRFVKFEYAKDLLSLGVKFFLIQISALVMFQTSNIIITQFFGPAQVTPYSIAFKYFSVINMLFTIIITPFWSAHTEAWVKKDYTWIKTAIRNLLYIWLGFVVMGIIMLLFSDTFFQFWIGRHNMDNIEISYRLRYILLIYFLIFSFGGIFNMFINGVGVIKLQTISLIIGTLVFIPLTYFFIKVFNFGIESVALAMIIANFYSLFIAPIQYKKLINNRAYGIWGK